MKNSTKTQGQKSKLSAIFTIVLLMASAMLFVMPNQSVQAAVAAEQPKGGPLPSGATPSITLDSICYLSFRPNPIGVGQQLLVNIWTIPPLHVRRQFIAAFEVVITKPDGTKITIGPMDSYCGDSTAWFEYVPDEVGTWKLKFNFIGMWFPAGHYLEGVIYDAPTTILGQSSTSLQSAYYKPASTAEMTLTVQQNMVYSWPESPLPTDYWTRPANPEDREWWSILGSWPNTGVVGGGAYWPEKTNMYMSNYDFVPYVQAPNSAHIVWKEKKDIGGLIGGPARTVSLTTPGSGMTGSGYPTIVYAGRAYERYSKPGVNATSTPTYWKCYDIRTGQVYWDRPVETGEPAPAFVEYHNEGAEVPGAYARAGITVYLTAITSPSSTADGRIIKYNPWTGHVALNITGPPNGFSSTTLYGYPFVLSVQDRGAAAGANRYRLINWTIENNAGEWRFAGGGSQLTVQNFTERIISNISWPLSNLGTRQDFEAGVVVSVSSSSTPTGTGVSVGQRLVGVSLTTGTVLWNVTTNESLGYETFFSTSTAVADHGKFACLMNSGEVRAWDLRTGKVAWSTPITSDPWGSFGAYNVQSAYGLYFSNRYDGVHAIDWETGKVVWTFNAIATYPFETPYQYEGTVVYPFHGANMVADGKIYAFSVEHTPTQPITRGDKLYCLNATTGEQIWNISTSTSIAGSRVFQGAIADGYLALTNCYDGYLYVYGKGRSATTVTAAPKTSVHGSRVIIEGTVSDLSPAQPGTPCVAKETMGVWMEHLHANKPIPAQVKGVPVSLDTIDPNGNFIHIGVVTTDGLSGTFGFTWEPEVPGQYQVSATFMGDDSYGSSFATTYITVEEAPAATPTPVTEPAPDYMPMMYAILAVGIIAVIIGLLAFFRKR